MIASICNHGESMSKASSSYMSVVFNYLPKRFLLTPVP